jgi:hypothetical protein
MDNLKLADANQQTPLPTSKAAFLIWKKNLNSSFPFSKSRVVRQGRQPSRGCGLSGGIRSIRY